MKAGDLILFNEGRIGGGGFIFGRKDSNQDLPFVIFDIEDADVFLILEVKETFYGIFYKIVGRHLSTWIFEDEIVYFDKIENPA